MRVVDAIVVAALIACGGGSKNNVETTPKLPPPQAETNPVEAKQPAPDPGLRILAELRGHGSEMCECTDYACARKTARVFAIWMKHVSKTYPQSVLDNNKDDFMTRFEVFRLCFNKLAPKDKHMPNPKLTGSSEAVIMEGFARQMCACNDMRCARPVNAEMMTWVTAHFKSGKRKGGKANVERWIAAQKRYAACYTTVINNSGPNKSPAPPADKTNTKP